MFFRSVDTFISIRESGTLRAIAVRTLPGQQGAPGWGSGSQHVIGDVPCDDFVRFSIFMAIKIAHLVGKRGLSSQVRVLKRIHNLHGFGRQLHEFAVDIDVWIGPPVRESSDFGGDDKNEWNSSRAELPPGLFQQALNRIKIGGGVELLIDVNQGLRFNIRE